MAARRFRCQKCGREFPSGPVLRDHDERRHPRTDVRWWMAVEDPSVLPFED